MSARVFIGVPHPGLTSGLYGAPRDPVRDELLAALKMLTFMARTSDGTADHDQELCAACDAADVAIRKAEGR